MQLSEVTFSFLDVETTGLAPENGACICEIAILKIRNWQQVACFHTLVNPDIPLPDYPLPVNHITPDMLAGQPGFSEVAPEIVRILSGSVVVCHNAPFDIGFLECELDHAGLKLPDVQIVDTLDLARKHYNFRNNKLGTIADSLGIETDTRHRALTDVITTCHILRHFVEDLEAKGRTTLEDIICSSG
jgi:DNA polymerase-3 subunit epsilon